MKMSVVEAGGADDDLKIRHESDGENENGKRKKSASVLLPKLAWPQMTTTGEPSHHQDLGRYMEGGDPGKQASDWLGLRDEGCPLDPTSYSDSCDEYSWVALVDAQEHQFHSRSSPSWTDLQRRGQQV